MRSTVGLLSVLGVVLAMSASVAAARLLREGGPPHHGAVRRLATTPQGGTIAFATATVFSVTTAGDPAWMTFSGTAGMRVSLRVSNVSISGWSVAIQTSSGSTVASCGQNCNYGSNFIDATTLPSDDTYTVRLTTGSTGNATITIWNIPPDASANGAAPTASGSSATVSITTPGQNGAISFPGTAGTRLSWLVSGGAGYGSTTLFAPNGTQIAVCGHSCNNGSGFVEPITLPADGTYTFFLDPPWDWTATVTITYYAVPPDVTSQITPTCCGGTLASFQIVSPGQNASATFSGTAGERISWTAAGGGGFGSVALYDSAGIQLAACGTGCNSGTGFHDPITLPAADTYSLVLDPNYANTGTVAVTVYQVPADASGTLALNSQQTLNITTPGQAAAVTFHGSAGEPITVSANGASGSNFLRLKGVWLYDPNGVQIANGGSISTTLASDGTYKYVFSPDWGGTGGVVFGLGQQSGGWESLPQTYGPCDGGLDALNQSGCWGDVNTLLGATTQQVTDASMPDIGIPFAYTRSYTSANTTSGRLGPGWTDSYSAAIVFQANGDAVVYDENGQQLYFAKQADGSFAPPPGGLATLSPNGQGYVLVNNDQTHLAFDSNGRLVSIVDRNNKGVTLGYDGSGNLATVTDSVGRVVAFTPNADGTLAKLALPDGRTVSYGYANGRLTSVTDLRGGLTSYGYDANGLLSSVTDQNHNTVETDHYTNGRIDTQTDALGKQTLFSWDGSTETITDANGHVWKDVYLNNMLVQTVDPLGDTTVYGYDASNNLTSIQDPRLNVTSMSYDARHNMLTRTAPAPLSYQETWTYDGFNDVLTYKDGRGQTTSYGYDSAGNLTSKTLPDPDGSGPLASPVIQYGRDPAGSGLLISLTDPNNRTTTYGYDSQGNRTSVTSPLGEKTTMGYDTVGRMTSRVDARGNVSGCGCAAAHTTTFGYDAADHLTSEQDPGLAHAKSWLYDPAGNLQTATDSNLHSVNYGYDADERLQTVTAADGTSVTRYDYDPAGNLYHRTDPNNHITTYGYDNANRLTTISLPPITRPSSYTPVWTYGYDANGNQTSVLDPNGATTTRSFDQLNRLSQVSYSGGAATPAVGYGYDADSNLTQLSDGDGTATYSYDYDNRLTGVSRVHTAGGTDAFAYVYDPAGNVTSRTYPDGTVVGYGYDNDERLGSVTVGSASTSYGYDPASNLTNKTTPDGYVETRTYDNANRLTQIATKKGSTTLSSFTYTLDGADNITAVTGTNPETFTYDSRDRLTSVCFQTSTCTRKQDPYIAWTYDPVGNRLSETRGVGGTVTNYTYNEDDQLLTAGSTTYSYDHNGNETQAGSRSFTYNAANELATTTSGSTTDTYSYDGNGNRQTDTAGTTTTRYAWDTNNPLDQLALECNGNGACTTSNPIRRYTYGLPNPGNDTIGFATPTAPYYYHYDGTGNTVNVTDASGTTQWTYSYEPFGNPRTAQGAKNAPTNPLRFQGQYLDTTNLYNLRARQYDPTSGRFLETDPTPAGPDTPYQTTYDYAGQDPVDNYDLSGENTIAHPILTGFGALLFVAFAPCLANPQACNSGNTIIIKKIADIIRQAVKPPPSQFPPDFNDPTKGPEGWSKRGPDPAGGKGGYVNPDDPAESWHPDVNHAPPIGPHWDHNRRGFPKTRYGPGWKKQ